MIHHLLASCASWALCPLNLSVSVSGRIRCLAGARNSRGEVTRRNSRSSTRHRLSFSFAGRWHRISSCLDSTRTADLRAVSPLVCGSDPYPCGSLTYRLDLKLKPLAGFVNRGATGVSPWRCAALCGVVRNIWIIGLTVVTAFLTAFPRLADGEARSAAVWRTAYACVLLCRVTGRRIGLSLHRGSAALPQGLRGESAGFPGQRAGNTDCWAHRRYVGSNVCGESKGCALICGSDRR
jgi:hypothetical protein